MKLTRYNVLAVAMIVSFSAVCAAMLAVAVYFFSGWFGYRPSMQEMLLVVAACLVAFATWLSQVHKNRNTGGPDGRSQS